MNAAPSRYAFPLAALVIASAVTVAGVSSHGLWDPLELDRLDTMATGSAPSGPVGEAAARLAAELTGGAHAAERLPLSVFGLLAIVATFALARLASDARGASYAALLLCGAPVLILNSRLVLGQATTLLAQTAVALGAFTVLVADRKRAPYAYAGLAAALVFAALDGGLLLGALPPLLAAAALSLTVRSRATPRLARAVLTSAALAIAGAVTLDVWRDAAEFRFTLGGTPRGDEPPAFHHALEVAFHGLGPLAALAPLGAKWFFLDERDDARARLGLFCILWASAGYGAYVLYEARYGVTTFAAAPAVAVLVALALRERDASDEGSRLSALVVALLFGLYLRDAALFPASTFDALPVRGLAVPEDVDLRLPLASAGLLFAIVAVSVLAARASGPPPSFGAPYRALRDRFRATIGTKVRLLALAACIVASAAVGIAGLVAPDSLPVRSVVARGLGGLALATAALPAIVALAQLALRAARSLGRVRHGAIAFAAGAFGLVFTFGTLETISRAFSPRETFEVLAAHRAEGEPLVVYEAAERSLRHYADEPYSLVSNSHELTRALRTDERIWLIFPKTRLAEANRSFRAAHGEHLFVVDAENPLAYLATTGAVDGVRNQSPLAPFVTRTAPPLAHPIGAKLAGGYELVAYEIAGQPEAVHPGERFTLRLLWHAARRGARAYQVFVHMDGPSGRVHGDHEPVDGLYPPNLWQAGDFILDEVEMRVPAHYAPGAYSLYVGLYQGSHRAEVLEGNEDSDDRVIAGAVQVR